MNKIVVSDDRKHIDIVSPEGIETYVRSARPEGFTDEEIDYAKNLPIPKLVCGQVNRTWKEGKFLLQVNTGPPVWWMPRIELSRHHVMIGWFKGLIALSWGPHEEGD